MYNSFLTLFKNYKVKNIDQIYFDAIIDNPRSSSDPASFVIH